MGSYIAVDEIAHIKERERLSIIQRNRAKKSIVQPPRWWRADVARRDCEGTGASGKGARGVAKSPGGPPNSPGDACIYASATLSTAYT